MIKNTGQVCAAAARTSIIVLFFVIAFIIGTSYTCTAAESDAPGGSYKTTCKDVRVDKTAGHITGANCKKMNGSWKGTRLDNYKKCLDDQGDIENCDGTLRCTGVGIPSGSYTRSCFCCAMSGSTLHCYCKNTKGSVISTSLAGANNCTPSNSNGRLRCR